MELTARIEGKHVYLDANIFIYAFEGFAAFAPLLHQLFTHLARGAWRATTSELTVAELLVGPYQKGMATQASIYLTFLQNQPNLALVPISRPVLLQAAQLRAAMKGIKLPDAIHMATGLATECHFFLTNDTHLSTHAGLEILHLQDFVDGR